MKPALRWRKSWPPYRRPSLKNPCSILGPDVSGGFAAKEVIVATLGTAYSLGEQDPEEATSLAERLAQDPNWNKATALSLMLFVLLYSPCFVALVVIRQEAGSWGWVAFSMIFNTVFAYGVAAAAYRICMAL